MRNNKNFDRGICFLLCLFLGTFGIHRFYAGENSGGIFILVSFVFLWWLIIPPIIAGILILYDLITILFGSLDPPDSSPYN